jgi:HDOD domain-containing protein
MVRPVTDAQAPADAGRLAAAVDQFGRLPVLSATVRRVQAIARSEEAGVGDMVGALEADQGLATEVLRYANSAACVRPLRARTVRAAVTLIGRTTIAQLALETATFRFFQRAPGNGGRSIGHLHLHAAAVAGVAQAIAERTSANRDAAHLGDDAAAAVLDAVAAAFAGGSGGPSVGVSIGAASPGDSAHSLACVLSRADEALYEAKRAGRGRAVRL